MSDYTVEDIQHAWKVGFEAGVAFTLRQFTENGTDIGDISKFIMELERLRPWKTINEWKELVEKNCICEGRDA